MGDISATRRYVGLLDGEIGAYGIVIPDLPGCCAMGDTIEEALRHAVLAAEDWAREIVGDGETVPLPRPPEGVLADPHVVEELARGSALVLLPPIAV